MQRSELIVVPFMLIAATPVGAIRKTLTLSTALNASLSILVHAC